MATILVVEDEPALLGMLVRVLTHAGLGDVLSAPNGAVALKLIEEHPVHVVVTDLLMPHVTGYDLIDRLREHPARILVLSAVSPSLVSESARARVDAVLEKPLRPRVLVEAVRTAVQKLEAAEPPR